MPITHEHSLLYLNFQDIFHILNELLHFSFDNFLLKESNSMIFNLFEFLK